MTIPLPWPCIRSRSCWASRQYRLGLAELAEPVQQQAEVAQRRQQLGPGRAAAKLGDRLPRRLDGCPQSIDEAEHARHGAVEVATVGRAAVRHHPAAMRFQRLHRPRLVAEQGHPPGRGASELEGNARQVERHGAIDRCNAGLEGIGVGAVGIPLVSAEQQAQPLLLGVGESGHAAHAGLARDHRIGRKVDGLSLLEHVEQRGDGAALLEAGGGRVEQRALLERTRRLGRGMGRQAVGIAGALRLAGLLPVHGHVGRLPLVLRQVLGDEATHELGDRAWRCCDSTPALITSWTNRRP